MQSIVSMLILVMFTFNSFGQTSIAPKTLPLNTKSKVAKNAAMKGIESFMNIEMPDAYQYFTQALKQDPNFLVANVFMSFITRGETSKSYAKKAIALSKGKTEGEQLFASLVDDKKNDETKEIWTKLHNIYPDCAVAGNYFVWSRSTPDERFAAAQDYLSQFPTKAWIHNTLGYYYMNDKKDMVMAKKHFEKYISLYPNGYNPHDSMGEYYLENGDTENAEKHYNMALEKYPFNVSSLEAIKKINDGKKKVE